MAANTTPKSPDPRRRRTRILGWMLPAALVLLAEAIGRLWLVHVQGMPAGRPDAPVLAYYPELRPAWVTPIAPDDGHFDLLILAGSVFFDYYGGPAMHLRTALEARGASNARVWNMAWPAHGSRDSLIKYRWLGHKRFDAVLVYHGINELRANNAPADRFRPDYAHMAWYAEVNRVAGRPLAAPLSWLAVPRLAGWTWAGVDRLLRPPVVAVDGIPSPQAMADGGEIKTRASFRSNLQQIAVLARERGEPLILSTFAHHLDPAYSKERLLHDQGLSEARVRRGAVRRLDARRQLAYAAPLYADFAQPNEIWGRTEHLLAGLAAHNQAVRDLAEEMKLGWVDGEAAVPKSADQFIDLCHLAPAGVGSLTRALAPAILEAAGPKWGEIKTDR